MLCGDVCDFKDPALRGFDEVKNFFADTRGDGDGDGRFKHGFSKRLAANIDRDFDLWALLLKKNIRCIGHLKRQIFEIDTLHVEHRRVGILSLICLGVLVRHK